MGFGCRLERDHGVGLRLFTAYEPARDLLPRFTTQIFFAKNMVTTLVAGRAFMHMFMAASESADVHTRETRAFCDSEAT